MNKILFKGILILASLLWGINLNAQYCAVSTTSTSDYLSAVSSSGATTDVSYSATTQPSGSYADETAQTLTTYGTQTFDIITTYVGGSNGVNIWVDWGNDFTFDASDLIAYQVDGSAIKTFTITVPNGIPMGSYRARVRGQWGSSANPPACGSVSYGSTVDFTLVIATPPSCLSPTSLVATNIMGTTANFAWTESGTATTWNVEWGASGFTPGTSTQAGSDIGNITQNSSLTGLSTSTDYDVYVQANCGSGDLSYWAGPITITTSCGTFTAPFYEGFNAAVQPNCWENLSSIVNTSINNTWNFNKQGEYGALNNGRTIGTFVSSDGSTPNPDSMMLITPWINLSALTVPELTFEWFSNNTNTPGDNVPLHIDVNNGTTWTNVATYIGDNPLWLEESIILSAYAGGTIQVRFRTDQTVPITAYHNDILLDEVSIHEAPTCPQPTALMASNVTANSVALAWTETGSAIAWNVEYGPVGYTQGSAAGTSVPANSNPFNLTGLNPSTDYDVYLQSSCGAADLSTWEGPINFSTLCLTQMAGNYTVGVGGDYANFTAAVSELNLCGISSAVTLTALTGSGPFNEQLIIEEIVGASATNTITFNGNGETLTSTTTTGAKNLILLDGADYITINNFNLVTQSLTDNYVIQLINDADFNTVSNNTIDLTSTITSTSSSNAGIVVSGSLTSTTSTTGTSGSDNTIIGNTITGGYYGITLCGQSATPTENNIISDNTLEDFYYYGIYSPYGKNSVISNNEISRPARTTVSSFYAMYLTSGGEGNTVSGNYIHTPFGGITAASTSISYGIYFSAQDSPLGNESKVYNNIIHLSGNNGTMYGIYNSSSDGVHYYYNTIVMDDANSTSGIARGFYQTSLATNIEFKNNIVSITRGGTGSKQCMYFSTTTSSIVSDNNVLYMNAPAGTNSIGYYSSARTTLTDWQTASSVDANSVDADPVLISSVSANQIPTSALVNNIGVPIPGVTTDFNGNSRNATTPDPGAHEFSPPSCFQPTDLSVSNITGTTADLEWVETGSATLWDIEWGTLGFTPTGTPSVTGTTNNPHPLTGLTVLTDYDFYVRSKCGVGDLSTWAGPFSFTTGCAAQMAGVYSVGVGGDFLNFTEAVNSLNSCGISAAVTLNALIGSGPFVEQLIIGEVVGSSATNTITFNGNGETLTSTTTASDRSLILLNGSDYITINDFNLVTQSDLNNFVIQLTNAADHNTISNNIVDMTSTLSNTGSTNAGIVVSGSLTSATVTTGASGSDNTITGNTIIGGYYSININGESTTYSENNIISDNIIEDFYYYGISLRYNKNDVVSNNDISRPNRATVSIFYALYYASGGEGHIISENHIHSAFGGIVSTSTSTGYGVYFTAQDSPLGNESQVHNNIIHLSGNNGTMYGIYNSSSDGVHYYYNTIVMDDASSTSGIARGFYQTSLATNIEFKNNIVSITRGGTGSKQCIYLGTSTSTIVSDYNVLYMNAPAGTNDVGYSGGAQATLAAWQNATSGDANSVDVDPILISSASAKQLPTSPAVNNIATPIASVTTDFNGVLRNSTTPDPGAQEFTPPTCPQPSNIAAINITSTSLDLVWVETGTATAWTIEWGAAGFTPGSGTTVSASTTTSSFINLNSSTEYDFYVQSDCGSGDLSTWSGPYSVYTACGVMMAPFYEGFNSGVQPQCWENLSSDLTSSSVNNLWIFNLAGEYGALNNGKPAGTYTKSDGSVPTPDSMMLITPEIDLSLLTVPVLSFEWFSNNTDNPGDNVPLIVEVFDGTTWHFIDTLKGDNPSWLEETYDLSAFSNSIIQVRFMTNQTTTISSAWFNDILLDEVRIDEAPICDAPTVLTATNLTSSSADLSWTEVGSATTWNIEWGTAGFVLGSGTVENSLTTNSYALTGLGINSDYEFYVQSNCAFNQSIWFGPFAFTTLCTSSTGTDTQIACASFTWIDGVTYTASNNTATHTIVGGDVNGCDSIVTLDLTIDPTHTVTGTDTQIACDSYTWIDGLTYTASNNTATHTIVGGSVHGCDSIVTLDLTINNSVTATDTRIACGSFVWIDGVAYTASNNTATHTIVGGAANGCDSIVTLDLTLSSILYGTDTKSACGSYTWIDGVTYTSSNNTATHALIGGSANGCDSIVTLNLTVNYAVTGTDTQVACDSYTWIDGVTYTASNNTATHTLVGGSIHGCDSTVTLNLTINNSNTGTDTQVACDSYTWIDGVTYTSSNNTATHTLTNAAGCDSIVTLNLTINNTATGVDTQVACNSYLWINGVTYTSSNNTATHTIIGGSVHGCDSIVTLNLTINNTATGTFTHSACNSYTWINGVTYTASNNTATHTLVGGSVHGCDSIVTLNLTINNSVTGTFTHAACDSYTWIDGVTYTASNNTATHTLVGGSVHGCDSTVTLNLTINNSVTGTDTQVACDSYTWIDGVTYTASNNTATHTIVGGSVHGCDSTVTLDLTIDAVNNAGDDNAITVCMNQPMDLDTLLSSGAHTGGTWLNPAGVPLTSSIITSSNTGGVYEYSYEVSSGSCPTVTAVMTITVDQGCDYLKVDTESMVDISVYPNPATSILTILNPSNTSSLKVEMLDMNGRVVLVENKALNNATQATLAIDYLERGVYTLRVYNNKGQKTFKIVKH